MNGNLAAFAELSGRVKYFGANAGEVNNADTCMEDFALLVCGGEHNHNPELRTLLESTFAYVMTWQYDKGNPAGNRFQIAIGYQQAKMAFRVHSKGVWTPWMLVATVST